MIHSYLAKEITSLNAIELSTAPRFKSVAIDNVPFQPSLFSISDSEGGDLLQGLYNWALSEQNDYLIES